jgi:hypothetical protein
MKYEIHTSILVALGWMTFSSRVAIDKTRGFSI